MGRLLWAAILASFVAFLDGTIVSIALPAIARDVGGGVTVQQWVVSGYLLAVSALILLAGAVTDAFGRLRVLRIALVAFVATSLLCAAAPTAGVLVAARILQGVAGALLVPGSLSLIIAVFDGEAQSRAIGRWTAWTSVSFLIGPIAGGLLVDALGWRSVFALTVLPAAAAMLLLGRIGDGPGPERRARIDLGSGALAALGLGALTTGLIAIGSRTEATALPTWLPVTLLIAGPVLLAAFLLRDRAAASPLIPPVLFAARDFAAGNVATLFIYAGLGLQSILPSLFLQQVAGLPAALVAAVALPSTIANILLSGRFGALAGRYGPRPFMTAGPLIAAAGAALMSAVHDPAAALAVVVPGTFLFGIGLSMTVAPLTAAVLGAVPPALSGIGSAVNNAVARVAGLLSTACIGLLLGGAVTTGGFQRGVLTVAGLLAIGAAASWVGIARRVSPRVAQP